MTAKQKANAQRFKKAIAEAKKLRKKNPKLTQAQAVKQAWAILYKTGKVAGAKKTATKKPVRKKSTAKSYHKDTKSHNVRINVISGVKSISKSEILSIDKALKSWEKTYGELAKAHLLEKSPKLRKSISQDMKLVKKIISDHKKFKTI